MGRLIDVDILIAELKESAFHHCNNSREDSLLQRDRVIVRAQPTVEAIPKADYENRLKADMVAILKEISTTIEGEREDCEKLSNSYERFGIRAMAQRSQIVIQQKIDNLQVNNSKVRDCATCNYMD